MDNLEKLALLGTQDEEKQNKNTTQYVGHHYAQTNTNNVNKTRALNPGLISYILLGINAVSLFL
jgi:hypothetical protein